MAVTAASPEHLEAVPDLANAFNHAPVATLVLERNGRVTMANLAAIRLLDRAESDIVGHDLSSLVRSNERLTIEVAIDAATNFAAPTIRRRSVSLSNDDAASATLYLAGLDDGSVVAQLVETFGRDQGGATIEEQRAFRTALIELSELSYQQIDDAEFYDTLLRRTIGVVPGAQAGSILVRKPDTDEYHFAAANGFDLEQLQTGHLQAHEMFRDVENPSARIDYDVAKLGLDPVKDEWLSTAGRLREIVVNVSAPVMINDEAVAFISLDNFEHPDAMGETSVEMTTVLGRLIADLIRRRQLESELRRERESFEHLAMHDDLTGLANRRQIEAAFRKALDEVRVTHQPLAVFFIDIDDFKAVNDRYGHDVGDEVLIAVARTLADGTRGSDLVGRWGGDEFMIVAPGTQSPASAATLARRMLDSFADDITLADGRTVPCKLSIGAAWSRDGSEGDAMLVQRADIALYDAKHAGKNTFEVSLD